MKFKRWVASISSNQVTKLLASKELILKELESGKSKSLIAHKVKEILLKENEEYKSQYQLLKDQRDEAQQK